MYINLSAPAFVFSNKLSVIHFTCFCATIFCAGTDQNHQEENIFTQLAGIVIGIMVKNLTECMEPLELVTGSLESDKKVSKRRLGMDGFIYVRRRYHNYFISIGGVLVFDVSRRESYIMGR